MLSKSTIIRYAIWQAYKQRCIYTGKLIENFDDVEIDHIIPQDSNNEVIANKIKLYNLDADFSIDSIENLVLTFKLPNRLKTNNHFDESSERYFLSIAKSKKIAIEQERLKFSKKLKKEELFAIKLAVKEQNVNYLPKGEFKIKRIIDIRDDNYSTNFYSNSSLNVSINAYIPSKYNEIGSGVIEIKGIDTMISITHISIMELIKNKNRQGLLNYIFKGYSDNNTKSFIIIGTNAVHLLNEVFEQLINLLEDFLNVYEVNYQIFETYIGSNNFKRSEVSDGYILESLNKLQWTKLLEYSKKYDLDNWSLGKFHFNYNENQIICLDKSLNNIVFWLIPGEIQLNSLRSFIKGNINLEIIWRIPSTEDRIRIKSGNVWTAVQTYEWMMKIID